MGTTMKIRLCYISALFFVLIVSQRGLAFEKVGTTSFQFLKIMADARATAMGEAYAAAVDKSDAVFWNPGALTKVEGSDVTFSYLDYFLDVRHFSIGAAFNLGGFGTIGFQGMVVDIGEVEVTRVSSLGFIGEDYNPGLTGETIHPNAVVAGVSFAKKLTDKFSFGLTAKYVREDMDFQSSYGSVEDNYYHRKSTFVFDGGLLYETGFRTLQLAAVVRHFGPEVKYVDEGYPLPQTFDIGLSSYLFGPDESWFFSSGTQKLLVTFDMLQPRDYGQQYNAGLEYSFQDIIQLRAGYKMNYDEEGLTLGFGLNYSGYRIDYSFNDFGDYLDSVHRFTIGFSFE